MEDGFDGQINRPTSRISGMRPAHEKHCFVIGCKGKAKKVRRLARADRSGKRDADASMQLLVRPTRGPQGIKNRDKKKCTTSTCVSRKHRAPAGEGWSSFSYTAWSSHLACAFCVLLQAYRMIVERLTKIIGHVSCGLHGGQSERGLTLQQRIQIYMKPTPGFRRSDAVEAQTCLAEARRCVASDLMGWCDHH